LGLKASLAAIMGHTKIKSEHTDLAELASRLSEAVFGEVLADHCLAPYTSYQIGGAAAIWVAPGTEEDVGHALEIISKTEIPLVVIGRGSNLLISDHGWNGVALYIGENLSGWSFENHQANVLAGTLLMDLVRCAVEKGLTGMELLAGIPGGIGGALRMNAGAFGQEIEDVTVTVRGFQPNGTRRQVDRDQIDFGYRRAPDLDDMIITAGSFHFLEAEPAVLEARMAQILAIRAKKQPLKFPSCGSVFKRPSGYYAGALIDEAGLKGTRIGGAMISRKHAGFILNVANASAADVYNLIRLIEDQVLDRFGIRLQREVRLIGDFE
jgi:UDP-N-acetylmuramate dehydrogenase